MNAGPSGFNNAPVTRAICVACGIFTVVFGISGRSKNIALSYEDIFKKLKLWKLVASVFGFQSTPELIFGVLLLYYFRVFERQMGSNKYSVFVLFSVAVSLLLEAHALFLFKSPIFNNILGDPSLNILSSGPYGLIFSSFVSFYCDIPVTKQYRVSTPALNLSFSDKTFIYVAGVQLLLSSWKRSMIPGICGILAGCFYRLNIFRIRRRKFPESITSFFSRLSWPSIGSTSPTAPSSRNIPGIAPPIAGHRMEESYPVPPPSIAEPSEDSIATLVSMGFERNSARQALVRSRNDISAATDILLRSQTH